MSVETPHRHVLVIGGSRGLGLAITEQYLLRGAASVVATVRSSATGLDELRGRWPDQLEIEHLDITDVSEVAALAARLDGRRFDLLFINAGVTNAPEETSADVPTEEFVRLMVTNALSPMRVMQALEDHVVADGTIAIMSSGQGSIANNERGGFEIYRASKSALNQLMRSYGARRRDGRRTLLLLAPGWVQTDLGGPGAPLTIAQSIPRLVATVDAQHHTGGLRFLDYRGETVRW